MKLRCDVGKEDKRRRRDTALSGIKNPDSTTARTDWWMLRGDRLNESIQLAGWYSLLSCFSDSIDGFQHLRRALAGERGYMKDRRVVEKLRLLPQFVVEAL